MQSMPLVIEHFAVDAVGFVGGREEVSPIHHDYVAPFFAPYPDYLTAAERTMIAPLRGMPRTVLVTKTAYSTSIEVTIGNFAGILPPVISVSHSSLNGIWSRFRVVLPTKGGHFTRRFHRP